ncbi:CopD family protein [Agrobacterium vaccinii]|uniref:CopD family protein n=1 Tax=Agrobacterium vaccinii TaxID=2735528 RepID=UPI001E4B8EF9|nr:CopD family protein [Agrobacterium vaccinii]UHS61296.1 CopD family protein [Agrobacterium vaccinii]
MTPHDALVIDRFLLDSALSLVWGGLGFTQLASGGVRSRLLVTMRTPMMASCAVACLAAIAALPLQTAEIGSHWSAGWQMELLTSVAFMTDVGVSTVTEAATVAALVAAALSGRRNPTLSLAGLALFSVATRGHAAASFDLLGSLQILLLAIHILAAAAWVGALIPFILVVRMSIPPDLRRDAIASMRRFSRFGHWAVALVFVTGVANTLLILGHIPADLNSAYQFKLLLKVAVVLSMTSLAVANRYLIVPLHRHHADLSRCALLFGAGAEIALGMLAFSLVASFGLDDPTV